MENHVNQYLQPENHIDNRSYERQGLEIEPKYTLDIVLESTPLPIKETGSKVALSLEEIKSLKRKFSP